MHIESHYTGKSEEYVDRMVVEGPDEDMRFEAAFMLGAGVNCGRTATDYSDPLQKKFPRTYSVEATETIVKGLYKAMYGPPAGYWVIGPENARQLLSRTLWTRKTVMPLAAVLFDEDELPQDAWKNYGIHNNAN